MGTSLSPTVHQGPGLEEGGVPRAGLAQGPQTERCRLATLTWSKSILNIPDPVEPHGEAGEKAGGLGPLEGAQRESALPLLCSSLPHLLPPSQPILDPAHAPE